MKLLLVCTSGGHFSTMEGLRSFWSVHHRVWVTHRAKDTESLIGKETVRWLPYQAPRDIWALLYNLLPILRIVMQEKPDLIISTGASVAVGFAFAAKVFGIRFIYIESISRSQDLSISGKLVYPLSDSFYVQWPNLAQKYRKAVFKGYV